VPTSSQLAAFAGAQTSVGINMNTNGGETVGAIEVESGKTNNILLGNSSGSGSGTLTLIGVIVNGIENVVLRNYNTNLLTLQNPLTNQTTLMNLAFANGTNNKILVDSSGGITISSAITSASGPVTVGGTGSGTVTFSGQNTFSTQTSVEGATLRLNRSGGTTLPVTNNMSVSNGTLKISTNQALNDLSLTGGTLLVDAGATLTINGTLTVSGGTITNNGTIAYGASGALVYGSSARTVGAVL
jgi:autotransporter-associated beta strand protein/adhesin HecA-like repeat protein